MLRFKFVLILVFSFLSINLFAQQNSEEMTKANKLTGEKKFNEAIEIYKEVVKNNDSNSMAWYYLGSAEYNIKDYEDAIKSYTKASEGLTGPFVKYNLACVYALNGNKEKALESLQDAANKGYGQYKAMLADNDLASIKDEKKFNEISEQVKINGNPCLARDEYNQFDFWVGKWDVVSPSGQHAGESEIDLMNNGCTIVENWYGTNGSQGKSFNYFDTTDNKWHQFWINQNAQKTTFEGKLIDGNMVYYSYDHVNDNTKPYLQRLTFFNLGLDKVRQFDELSYDQGKTWTVGYDLIYNRKSNSN